MFMPPAVSICGHRRGGRGAPSASSRCSSLSAIPDPKLSRSAACTLNKASPWPLTAPLTNTAVNNGTAGLSVAAREIVLRFGRFVASVQSGRALRGLSLHGALQRPDPFRVADRLSEESRSDHSREEDFGLPVG